MLVDRMDKKVLSALIEALPAEITVIDHNDEVVGWNRHEKRLFHRPMSAMGLNFRQCHPEKSLPMVERIVSEMRSGARDSARFWIDMNIPGGGTRKIVIEFHALRGPGQEYLGCLEFTQDVQAYRDLQGQKRLLD